MKTIQDFYDKYGTGKNYEDFFAMMCRAKKEQNPALAIDASMIAAIFERGSFTAWQAHVHDAVGICAFVVMVNVVFLGTFALIVSEARKSWN